MLRRYVRDYLRSHAGDTVDFAWQGGEPTLAGLDFIVRRWNTNSTMQTVKLLQTAFKPTALPLIASGPHFCRTPFSDWSVGGWP